MIRSNYQQILLRSGIQLLAIGLLIWPAFLNGYPLLTADSGTYLTSGQNAVVPVDRPIMYGFFARHISMSWSVWLIIIAQSLLFNYLVYLISRYFIQSKRASITQLGIVAFLAIGTVAAEYTSLIMTDIFASLLFLAYFLLLIVDKLGSFNRIGLSVIILFSLTIHLSHIPIIFSVLIGIGIILFIFYREYFKRYGSRIFISISLLFSAVLGLCAINYSLDAGFQLARASNIMWACRFIESGIANDYLKQHCGQTDFNPSYQELCAYTDQFDKWPTAGIYLFDNSSPLYAGDCGDSTWSNCWLQKNEAYGDLIIDLLADESARMNYMKVVVGGTAEQLIDLHVSKMKPFIYPWIINHHFSIDSNAFANSDQFQAYYDNSRTDRIEDVTLILALIMLLYLRWKYWKQLPIASKLFILMMLLLLFFNALISSSLSNVVPRYQERITFLLPLVVLCVYLKLRMAQRKEQLSRR